MSASATAPYPIPPAAGRRPAAAAAERDRLDAWPHTNRVMPWLLAGFLVMLWLIPFQSIRLPISLPVDARLDRFALAGLVVIWVAALLAGGSAAPRLRRTPLNWAVAAFVGIALASVVLNLQALVNVDDFALALKKLALLFAYAGFFFVAASVLRPAEVRSFVGFTIGLACIAALGTIWEYRTGTNLFYDLTAKVLPPGFSLEPETADPEFGRPSITGPTQHGLTLSTMLAFALPFTVVGVVRSPTLTRKLVYGAATALILAGTMATLRKTAVMVPAASLLIVVIYWRREIVRLAPLGLVLIVIIQALSPGALTSIRYELEPETLTSSTSTQGRTEDYAAVAPDVKTHLATGRGYGTYDSHKYRLLDNQYLVLLIETGVLGALAFIGMVFAVVAVAHRVIRSGDPERAPPALAAAAAVGALLVTTALFDVLAFPQGPYLFFFMAAIAVVCAVKPESGSPTRAAQKTLQPVR
jgi:hypothetical protein